MASLKYEIPLLDRNTRFALWQIKMQAVLVQMDLEDALLGVDKMPSILIDEEKKRKDRKVLTQLYLHLSNEILQDVVKKKTIAALWKRLEQICMSKTLTSKLHMKQRLYAYRLEKVDEVYDSLTSYDKMKDLMVKPGSQGEGLIVRGRQDWNADDDRGRTQERNPYGKSKGRSKSSNRGKQPENSSEADVVEDYSNGELLVASINNSKVSEEWILDSSYTFHMSPNRDWFTTYETVSEELKRNLILFNTLDSKGYRYTAESGVLKISKGSLVVMKGQRKTAKLYVLQGSTVTGDAVVASFSLSDDDITKLWHMHLGHMSENGAIQSAFERLCKSEWIVRHLTVRHTPQQNGVVERMNRTIMEKIRCNTPYPYSTPEQASVKGYKLWCPENRKVVISRDVVFDETAMLPNLSLKDSSNKENQKQVEHQINTESTPQASTKIKNRVASSPQYSIAKNRTKREIKPSKKYTEVDLITYALNVAEDIDANQDPSNYSEAVRTWDLVKLPEGKKAVRCKWVFKKKEGTLRVEEPRYKARLVAKGYSQIPGVDFTDVFFPVVKHSLIRALLGIVAIHDLELE
ncbi:hypothetical protein CXB51_005805 [Gossypium anomalum]|uniref:Integrase catalytic domain-containing protein n=1 Tax=Gossypium anomalum TaxID=47600 RepID=A0A8J5ZCQ2_9ROSI|nr:hypothetical protein CXB51_005805 [Gossypium anomalum]